MAYINLLELVKQRDVDENIGLVEELSKRQPEIDLFPAAPTNKTRFTTLVRTAVPEIGFRAINEGIDPVASTYANRLFECKLIDGRIEYDKQAPVAADVDESIIRARETVGYYQGAVKGIAKQIWKGTDNAANGFPGVDQFVSEDAGNFLKYNSLGGSSKTGDTVYSVYIARLDAYEGLSLIWGGDGNGILSNTAPEWKEGQGTDANGKKFASWYCDLPAWVGLCCSNKNAVMRIANIKDGELTDKVLARAIYQWSELSDLDPTHIFISKKARYDLQTSRNVVLAATGRTRANAETVATLPTDYDGIPIVATPALTTEAFLD